MTKTTQKPAAEADNEALLSNNLQARSMPSLCEFISTENPSDPKFDTLRLAIRTNLEKIPDGKEILDEIAAFKARNSIAVK